MSNENHATNIGKIVLHLANHHTPGDVADGWLNDPIVNIIDCRGLAADFVRALGEMSQERAAGIVNAVSAGDEGGRGHGWLSESVLP
jgi:hypothetical protein